MSVGQQAPQQQQPWAQPRLQTAIDQTLNQQLQQVPGMGNAGMQASVFDQDVYSSLLKQGIPPAQASAIQQYLMQNQYGGSSGVIGQGGGAAGMMNQWQQNNANQWAPGAAAAAVQAATTNPQATQAQQTAQQAIQPSYGTATTSGAAVDPSTTLSMILKGFAPQANMSTSALNNSLAAAGITGGGALDAQTALQRNLAAGIAPTLGSAVQSAQGMTLQQALDNAASQNQMTLANMDAANRAGSQLAGYLQQGWEAPLGQFGGLNQQGLGTAGSLAGQEASNFPVYQQSPIWSMLGQAAGTALGAYTGGFNPMSMFGGGGGGGFAPTNSLSDLTGMVPNQGLGNIALNVPGVYGNTINYGG